jgi:hypothetical protein
MVGRLGAKRQKDCQQKYKGTEEAKSKLNQLGLTGTSNLSAIDILRKKLST